ncbi:MAG: transglycosylase domain-containing protein [Faecousia sp.]
MANQNQNNKRRKKIRQEWNPHWSIKLIYTLGSTLLSAAKIAVGAAATVLLICLISGVVFMGALAEYLQNDILKEAQNWSYEDYDVEKTSYVHYVDNDGNIQLLQQIYTTTDRQPATWDEIPKALIDATVAIEDKRFYEHQGVDWITTIKACANMFFGGDSQFGGSTITQQLVKNTTDEKSITVQRKVMEIFRAQLLEKEYDKDVIMKEYLNRIYLGKGCYGVKSAAAAYFGKELQSLTVAECASLISITNNPSMFNPYSTSVYLYKGEMRNGEQRNRYRQESVLNEMLNQGYLTDEEYIEAFNQPLVFKDGIADEDRWAECDSCGYGGTVSTFVHEGDLYFCPRCGSQTSVSLNASQHIYSWFVDTVILDVAADMALQDGFVWDDMDQTARNYYLEKIQKGGYHIYTTLDLDVQNQVDAIYTDLNNIPTTRSTQQLQSGIVVIDNSTGDIVALAGGVGEKNDFFAYNKATQAKLQTGSAQKPLSVYAPAFEKGGYSPATVIRDMPLSYDGGAFPKNDSRVYSYSKTIFNGIVSSVNTIAANTLNQIGTDYSFSFAKYNFGQNYLVDRYVSSSGMNMSDIAISPLALGALTVGSTVREMSAAYATFSNNGVYRTARTYTKVYNSDGEIVLDNKQESRQILSEKTVNYINYCLYNAANNGTGTAAVFPGQNIAGKTGTTSSNRDRWFCGYTKYYTAAVWCGYNQPEQIYLTNNYANPAARLWKMVMQPIHNGLPQVGLYNGNAFRNVSVCLDSGLQASGACGSDVRGIARVVSVNCYPEDVPNGVCTKHVQVDYCVTGGGVATEYCRMSPDAVIETRSLVKLTPDEVNDIRAGLRVGLEDIYGSDSYVYYVDSYGNPLVWTGFSGYANNTEGTPYLCCPLHNQDTILNYPPDLDYGFEDGSSNIIYPDDNNDFNFDFGNNGGFDNGYNGGITGGDQFYGDYSGNGDVFF